MDFIYVRGGDKTAAIIAEQAGVYYGIRHDYTAYAPVHMLDIDFHHYEHLPKPEKRNFWSRYLERVTELKPFVAMAADYFNAEDGDLLRGQLDDLERLNVPVIMVCPKFHGAVEAIPPEYVIAISMPAPTYASFLPDFRVLDTRYVHLLGGRPEKQAEIGQKLLGAGARIVSVDGSYLAMKAARGQWFDGGRWVQVRGHRVLTIDLAVASTRNIVQYLRRAIETSQPMLFDD